MAEFIEMKLTGEQLEVVVQFLHFDEMSKRKMSNMQDVVDLSGRGKG